VLKLLCEFGNGDAIPSLPVQNVRLKTWQNLKYAKHLKSWQAHQLSNFEIAHE
jgi:hypothetical protein